MRYHDLLTDAAVPKPSPQHIQDAIEHASQFDKQFSRYDFALKYEGYLTVDEIGEFDDLSSWVEVESPEDLEDFRGGSFNREPQDMPPIILITTPYEGTCGTQVGDGRGRVNFAIAHNLRLYVWHLIHRGCKDDNLSESIYGYHGSSENNPTFAASHVGNNSHTFGSYSSTRHGCFFSDNPNFSAMYGSVKKYALNINHTIDLENDNNVIWNFVQSFDPHSHDRDMWLSARSSMFNNQYWQFFEDDVGERFIPFLQNLGYDSAMFREWHEDDNGTERQSKTIVVFDPKNIKYVDKN